MPLSALAEDRRLLVICISALAEDSIVEVATKNTKGDWHEHARLALRSSLVGDWISVGTGEIHILSNQDGAEKSIGSFTFPENASRALVILTADTEAGKYRIHAVDARIQGFAKGSTLILNLSEVNAMVALGATDAKVEAGKHHVAVVSGVENDSYRLTVSHDIDGQPTLCYDRQRVTNPNCRNILVLMTDINTGLRVEGLTLFGEMD
jgi:hypothetical protein